MKRFNIYTGFALLFAGLVMSACKKTDPEISLIPSAQLVSAKYVENGTEKNTAELSSIIVSKNASVVLEIEVKTDPSRKLKQITVFSTGNLDADTLANQGFLDSYGELLKVEGFNSSTSHKFVVVVNGVTSLATVTVQAFDDKGINSGTVFNINTIVAQAVASGVVVSDSASVDDAVAEGVERAGSFANATSSDFNFYYDEGSFSNGSFAETSSDLESITAMELYEEIVAATLEETIAVEAGKSYLVVAPNGNRGIVKVTAIEDGADSGKEKVVVKFDYLVLTTL